MRSITRNAYAAAGVHADRVTPWDHLRVDQQQVWERVTDFVNANPAASPLEIYREMGGTEQTLEDHPRLLAMVEAFKASVLDQARRQFQGILQ